MVPFQHNSDSGIPLLSLTMYKTQIEKHTTLSQCAGMWKTAYLIFTAAVSCDHYKGGKLHRNWECVKEPISSYYVFSLHLPLSDQLTVPVACMFSPSLFVFLEKGEQSRFISGISRKHPWQVLFSLYFIVQSNSYYWSWKRLNKVNTIDSISLS